MAYIVYPAINYTPHFHGLGTCKCGVTEDKFRENELMFDVIGYPAWWDSIILTDDVTLFISDLIVEISLAEWSW